MTTSATLILENGVELSLKAQWIHCVQTGIPVCNISDAFGIERLNILLTEGTLIAEGNAVKLFLSEECKAQLLSKAQWADSVYSTTLSNPLKWWVLSGPKNQGGKWIRNLGSEVGDHNKAVLKDCRVGCPKSQLYAGSKNRQYEAFKASTPRQSPKVNSPAITEMLTPKVSTNNSVAVDLGLDDSEAVDERWPTLSEWRAKGFGHNNYLARMAREFGLSEAEAKQLWGRNRRFRADLNKGKAAKLPCPDEVLKDFQGVQVPKEPEQFQTTAPKVLPAMLPSPTVDNGSEGTIVKVRPEALKGFLNGIEDATVISVADDGAILVRL